MKIGTMNRKKSILLIFAFFILLHYAFPTERNYKFLVYFKLESIFENPIFRWVKENKLSNEMSEIEYLLKFTGEINPHMDAYLVSTDKGAYMVFFDTVSVESLVEKINENPHFLLIKFNGKDVKVRSKDKFYHFLLRKNYFIFCRDGFRDFPFLGMTDFLKGKKERDLVIFFPPDVVSKLLKYRPEGNISKVVNSWEYVSIFPIKYDPLVFKILIKNKTISSSKRTESFFSILKSAFGEILKSNYFKNFEMDLKLKGSFTEITLFFPKNFSFH